MGQSEVDYIHALRMIVIATDWNHETKTGRTDFEFAIVNMNCLELSTSHFVIKTSEEIIGCEGSINIVYILSQNEIVSLGINSTC